jgi:GNAT superfamily N-acetyltransferase
MRGKSGYHFAMSVSNTPFALAVRPGHAAEAAALSTLVNSAYRGESSKAGWTTEADLLGGQRTDPEGLAEILRSHTNGNRDDDQANGHANDQAKDQVILVHTDALGLACCVHLQRLPDHRAYLGMLTVRPVDQAQGLGRALLAAAEQWAAREWGTREMQMTVIAQRAELIAWYERRGYARTGETAPFPYDDVRFGLPQRDDLYFLVLDKALPAD